ncbi:MAG: hypothetical protein JJ911_07795 [Rhizobiaceae bacterium]|nr:hypothetical protein [Rhizobiaceae bacterium]
MTQDPPALLDRIYTADEAAERLKLHKRGLIKIARRSGHCSRNGRSYLFSEADLLAIWQDMRAPPLSQVNVRRATATPVRSPHSIIEELKWLGSKPPTRANRREIEILRWLDRQKAPQTYKQIDRAGAKTIDSMLKRGLVLDCGTDREGLVQVRLAPAGRDQLKIVERWIRKREERRANRKSD